jgi:hypothetical protein
MHPHLRNLQFLKVDTVHAGSTVGFVFSLMMKMTTMTLMLMRVVAVLLEILHPPLPPDAYRIDVSELEGVCIGGRSGRRCN